jgi:hypothetical protein
VLVRNLDHTATVHASSRGTADTYILLFTHRPDFDSPSLFGRLLDKDKGKLVIYVNVVVVKFQCFGLEMLPPTLPRVKLHRQL